MLKNTISQEATKNKKASQTEMPFKRDISTAYLAELTFFASLLFRLAALFL